MFDRPPKHPEPAEHTTTARWRRRPVVLMAVLGVGVLGLIGAVVEPGTDTSAGERSAPATTADGSVDTADESAGEPTAPSVLVVEAPPALTVTHVVDGDTVDVSSGERVRLIGVDTPERGECGFDAATRRVEVLVAGASVRLVPGARDDVDRYGRILRYVEADGVDVGLTLIDEGLAISRYDSRDGYGAHTREREYQRADVGTPHVCGNRPQAASSAADVVESTASAFFANCDAARVAGVAPLQTDDPGYRSALDRDGDGIACE